MSEITPVTEWPDYAVDPQGGNPITQDLNAPYDKVRDGRAHDVNAADIKQGRPLLAASMHHPVLADHSGHRLPVRGHAPPQVRHDHDPAVAVLRLRVWHPVLGVRLLPLPVPNHQPDLGRSLPGRVAQRPRLPVARQHGHSGHSLYVGIFGSAHTHTHSRG